MTNKNELKSFHDLLLEGVPVGDLVTTVEKKGFIRIDEYGRYRRISPLSRIEHEISEGILDPLLASEDKQEAAVAKDYLRQVYQLLNENSLSYSDGCEQKIFDEEDGQLLGSYGWYEDAAGRYTTRIPKRTGENGNNGSSLKEATPAQLKALVKRLEKENDRLNSELEEANNLDIFQDVDEALHVPELQIAIRVYKEAVKVCDLEAGKKSMPGNKTPRNWMIDRAQEILTDLRNTDIDSAVERKDKELEDKLMKKITVDAKGIATICNWDREQINLK